MGAFLVGQTVVLVPAMFSGVFLELDRATEATLQLLFLLAGFAALMFGYIGRMLEQFEAAEDAGEGPHAASRRRVPARVTAARRGTGPPRP